jgi:hypothetical protein
VAKAKKSRSEIQDYRGVLAQPVRLRRQRSARSSSKTETYEYEPVDPNVLWSRVEALFEHYEVDENDWTTLCMRLASNHVPGFQFVTDLDPSMPIEWGVQKEFDLWFDVESLRREKSRINLSRAFTILATKERWKEHTETTLRKRYPGARESPLANLFRYMESQLGWNKAVSNMTEFGFLKKVPRASKG